MLSSATQKHRFAAIETPLGPDRLLLRFFSGREELGRLFDYQLTLLDAQQDVDPDSLVGLNVSVRLQVETDERDHTRYFNGFISSMTFAGYESGAGLYHAQMVPWLWLLTRTSDCRSFQDKTIPQILQEIFADYGLTHYRLELTGNYQPKPFCVQYNETTFNFLSRIMEHEGIYYWWEHQDGNHTMVITDDMATHIEHPLRGDIEWRGSTGTFEDGFMYHLRMQKTLSSGGFATNDYNFKTPKEDLRSRSNEKKRHAAASFEHFEYPGLYREGGTGETLSKIRLQEAQAQHEAINAQVTARAMATGYKFLLSRGERQDQEKKYLIVSSTVSIGVNTYQSGGDGSGDKFEGYISAIPDSTIFRPARLTPKPVMTGPQPALVVGPKGEEIHCDEHGRVKVHFYWDRRSEANAASSKWVRVSQASAGGQWGFMSIPRVGQEVLVEFMNGDPDQPIITGRVYNGENQYPYAPQSSKSRSSWKTNTYPGGGGFNELRFEDAKNNEQIFLHGQKDLDKRILNKDREWIGVSKHLITGQDSLEKIGRDKHETTMRHAIGEVKENQFTTIGGDDLKQVGKSFQVSAQESVGVFTEGNVEIKAKDDIGVTSMANVVVEGNTITLNVSGNFIKISPAGIVIEGKDVWINCQEGSPTALKEIEVKKIDAPHIPETAADAPSGKVDKSKGMGHQLNADSYPTKTVEDYAAADGSPFHETPAKPAATDDAAKKTNGTGKSDAKAVTDKLDKATKTAEDAGKKIKDATDEDSNFFKRTIADVKKAIQEVKDEIKEVTTKLKAKVNEVVGPIAEDIKEAADTIKDLADTVKETADTVKEVVDTAKEVKTKAEAILDDPVKGITDALKGSRDATKDLGKAADGAKAEAKDGAKTGGKEGAAKTGDQAAGKEGEKEPPSPVDEATKSVKEATASVESARKSVDELLKLF